MAQIAWCQKYLLRQHIHGKLLIVMCINILLHRLYLPMLHLRIDCKALFQKTDTLIEKFCDLLKIIRTVQPVNLLIQSHRFLLR